MKRNWFATSLLMSIFLIGLYASDRPAPAGTDPVLWRKAVRLTQKSFVADTHSDVTMRLGGTDYDFPPRQNREHKDYDFAVRQDRGHVDLPRLREGGYKVFTMGVFTPARTEGDAAVTHAITRLELLHQLLDRLPTQIRLFRDSRDLAKARPGAPIYLLFSLENGNPLLDNRPELLPLYYRLGVRMIGLCHNGTNHLSDSSTDTPKYHGLSDAGKKLIGELNRRGIMIDVSHMSDEATRQTVALSRSPVLASHSSCRAVCNVPRNLPDDLIQEIARRGGLIQINFAADFLSPEYEAKTKELRARLRPEIEKLRQKYGEDREAVYREARKLMDATPVPHPPMDALVDHVAHAVQVAGVDHVGLGSDFDGIGAMCEGMTGCQDMPLIVYHLLRRGFSEEQVAKIVGGNFRRFFREVEHAAGPAKTAPASPGPAPAPAKTDKTNSSK